jgi:hypothetical protein
LVWTSTLLALGLALVVALRFAQPIEDGDLFWQMAYGAQMAQRGSLRLDHSLWSWMPASNDVIYCAWTGELLFNQLWAWFGADGIFALRYAAVATVLGLLVVHARRQALLARPEAWLVLTITLLASVVATLPKPEMLSLVLWNGLAFCWFSLLEATARGRRSLVWIYAIPAIVLVWVNTHGGFILAAPFIVIITATSVFLLPRRAALHMLAAAVLCALATTINPYGPRYPLQLIGETLGRTSRPDIAWNNAFQPTFGGGGQYFHLPELMLWMAGLLAAAIWLSRRRDAVAVAILCLAYAPLYLIYVRSTFLLPALVGHGFLYLARDVKWPRASPALATAATLLLGSRAVWDAAVHPETGAWMGFGIGYTQPVDEAEFLAGGDYGPRIYNTYNAGGYLVWRLYPRDRVMVDARSFPYVGWFDELQAFTLTQDPAVFRAFLVRHPADVALVDFQEERVWRSFMAMPDWRPAFYGPDAAVFVPKARAPASVEAAASLQTLRNGRDVPRIFDFAIAVGDYATAWNLLDQADGPLHGQVGAGEMARMTAYRSGQDALRGGEYGLAWTRFSDAFRHHPIEGRDKPIMLLLRALQELKADDPRAETIRLALARLAAPA